MASVSMPPQMRAARFHGPGDIRIEQVERPKCAPDEVVIKPAFVGICGSDVHEWSQGPILIPTTQHPLTSAQAPLILGHEVSGVVETLGSGVIDFTVGQHVSIQPVLSDKTCKACRRGSNNLCKVQGFYGLSANGGLADYMVCKQENLKKLPANVPLEAGGEYQLEDLSLHALTENQPWSNRCLLLGTQYETAM
jgi:threonine dehydrogenase-like Zn-dependent dehydrogenase